MKTVVLKAHHSQDAKTHQFKSLEGHRKSYILTASSLTLISLVLALCQGYCQCGLLIQPPHQFQERAVGPGPKPGPAESTPAAADSAESWHLACHCCWVAHCHKGVQVAVPQPPLELPDHPQPCNFWQNRQSWWVSPISVTRQFWAWCTGISCTQLNVCL